MAHDPDNARVSQVVMSQALNAKLENQIIFLILGEDEAKYELVLDENVVKRLAAGSDESAPCTSVTFLGNTGGGKSFIEDKILELQGCSERPFSLDYTECEDGYCPISVTGNIHCFLRGNQLYFDVEGAGGTIPLLERIHMGIRDRLVITDKESQLQKLRKDIVGKAFPQLAFVMSTTIVYVTREPLNCDATNTAIAQFASAAAQDTCGVRPNLIIIHNVCPLNHLRLGEDAEAKLTNEYISTYDADGFLRSVFAGVTCMTFPDRDAYDKRKKIDGEAIFEEQIKHLHALLEKQKQEQIKNRTDKFCALSPHAMFRIMPKLIEQVQKGEKVSIPEVLSNHMKNNPDLDCLILSGIFNHIVREIKVQYGRALTEENVKRQVTGLALAMAVSARYLIYKFRKQDKVSFPDEWVSEQVEHLFHKLRHYTLSVFLLCWANYPKPHDKSDIPEGTDCVRCLQRYIGHDGHKTSCKVCPNDQTQHSFFVRIWRSLFGGFQDTWHGDFVIHPQFEEALNGSLKILMETHALEVVRILRVNAADSPSSASAEANGPAARLPAAAFEEFRSSNIRVISAYMDQLGNKLAPCVCNLAGEGATSDEYAFCVACFALVNERKQAFLLCSACQAQRLNKGPPDSKTCRLCMDKEKEFAIVPCGHTGVCAGCKPDIRNCPWCREPVTSMLKIYDA